MIFCQNRSAFAGRLDFEANNPVRLLLASRSAGWNSAGGEKQLAAGTSNVIDPEGSSRGA